MNFKTITHWFAVAITAVAAFALTPAGHALIAQYPKLTVVFGAAGALAALYHSPKATSMILICLLLGGGVMAQNVAPQPLFSVSTQAVAVRVGGQTVPGTDAIGSFNLTPRLQLQSDNILAPANNLQAYLGGVKYQFSWLDKTLAKSTLASIKPYFHGALGIVRNVPAAGTAQQHYSALAGVGFDYSVNGTLSFGPRVDYFNAPGFGRSPHGVVVSANLTVVLGSK